MCKIGSTACLFMETVARGRNGHNFFVAFITGIPLPPWSRVLLEKLTGSAASQEIPRHVGTRRFLTVPTSASHLSLS